MWYVFYWDSELYQTAMEEFKTEEEAMAFINDRVGVNYPADVFRLIRGEEIKLKEIEVTTKVVRA
jgi:hypothetical protein